MTQPAEYGFSKKVQTQILALLVRDIEFYNVAGKLIKPEYFTDEANVIIARAYLEKQDGSYTFDSAALAELVKKEASVTERPMLRSIRRRIRTLFTVDVATKFLTEQVVAFAKQQAMMNAFLKGLDHMKAGQPEKVLTEIRDATMVGEGAAGLGLDLFNCSPRTVLRSIQVGMVPTGLPSIDATLGGGLGVGEMGLILGPPGRGKSIVVQDIAAHATMIPNSVVLIVTLEMNENRYAARLFSRYTGMTKRECTKNTAQIRKQLKTIMNSTNSRLFIKEAPARSLVADQVYAYIRAVHNAGFPPTLVLVDYLDLLRASTPRHDKWVELEEMAVDLRSVASLAKVPIWAPTQGNRGSYGKSIVDIDDVADSWGKSKTADVILSLSQTLEERREGRMRIFFAKNRNERDKVAFEFMVDYERMRIHDLGVEV